LNPQSTREPDRISEPLRRFRRRESRTHVKVVDEGSDPQLERGIREVLKLMTEAPLKLPYRPDDPVKTKQVKPGQE